MSRRILVVEDSPTQAEAVRSELESKGYDVVVAANGDQGAMRFDAEPFDLVVSDIVMPGSLDGYALCRHIKASARRTTPVILLTSLADPLDIIKGLECGADNFLTKPHKREQLAERVELLIATRQTRNENRLHVDVDVFFLGRKFTISSGREQILDLLVSTFEDAVSQNRTLREREAELEAARAELARYAGTLEARLQPVLASVSDVLYSVDPALAKRYYISPSCEHVFGFADEDFTLRPGLWFDRVLGEDRTTVSAWLQRVIRARQSDRCEYRIRHRDGSVRWLEDAVVPIVNADGVVERLNGVARDITDRKLAEKTIRDQARRQAAVARLGSAALTADTVTDLYNEAAALVAETINVDYCHVLELLGDDGVLRVFAGVGWRPGVVGVATVPTRADSMAGFTLDAGAPVVAEDLRTESRFQVPDLLRDHGIVSGVVVPIGGHGRTFGAMGAFTAQRRSFTADDINFVQAVANILATVRDRRHAEAALHAAQARMAAILDIADDAIISVDDKQQVVLFNRGAEKMFGYSASDVLGQPLDMLLPREIAHAHRAHIHDFQAAPESARRMAERSEVTGRRKDGSAFPAEGSISKLVQEGEAIYTAIVRDLTDRRKLEDQFRQAQKMEAVGRLAGGIAHDFNNILTAILGFSDLLLSTCSDTDPHREELEEIRKAADRATGLTRQLLAFSRKQVLQLRVLDLNALVSGMDGMLRRVLGDDVRMSTALAGELGSVNADISQMEQILLNLAVNARDAMPHGGTLTIETANVELDNAYSEEHASVIPGPYVMLAVSDSGVGMDGETKAKIFEPFFTTKGLGRGTGLGLATVYGIVKQSRGFVWVYSEPGHGTTFKIYLPRVDAPAEAPDFAAPPQPTTAGEETLLLVEDNDGVRRLVRTVLQEKGYTVLEARDPVEAMTTAKSHAGSIALLLTDMVMPEMSGRAMASQLKAGRPTLRVLFMSGYSEEAAVNLVSLEGGMAFLQKPFTATTLCQKVREVLDQKPPNSGGTSA